jgi:hypothetical protein
MPKSKEAHVLVRLRRHLSLSQEQLAEWCDCSYYTIRRTGETEAVELACGANQYGHGCPGQVVARK